VRASGGGNDMSTANAPPLAPDDARSGLQFSIRSLLLLTAYCAVAVWLWPMERNDPLLLHFTVGTMTVSLIASLWLVPLAWRRFTERRRAGSSVRFERFAYNAAILGMVPYGAGLLMIFLDPYESGRITVHTLMVLLWITSASTWLPACVFLVVSLALNVGLRVNAPELLLRLLGLAGNCGALVSIWLVMRSD
jgi:hypothetical protein